MYGIRTYKIHFIEKAIHMDEPKPLSIEQDMNRLPWYHTIDLGQGLCTPGMYDHRPYLDAYGFPKDLKNRTVLDIGAASGFFSFELERRGADVTATELPTWMSHDFGPLYKPDMTPDEAQEYLHDPFLFARNVLKSKVKRKIINIYDISPETVGVFDLVFCGSVLLHLTDPIKALWRIQSVTKEVAIIATVIHPLQTDEPLALFLGQQRGDVWWFPNRPAFEAMLKAAGFQGWEWFSEFRADLRNGQPGPYHALIRAWNTPERPSLLDNTDHPAFDRVNPTIVTLPEIQHLKNLVNDYEKMWYVRFIKRYDQYRQKLGVWLRGKKQK
jgi:tRNA (mo5U34)-methyltransferase